MSMSVPRLINCNRIQNLTFLLLFTLQFLWKPLSTRATEESQLQREIISIFTLPFTVMENASEICLNNSKVYLNSLTKYESWAMQMYDASGKLNSGILTGNTKNLGNYDECLRIKTVYAFIGQACNAEIQFTFSKTAGDSDDTTLISSNHADRPEENSKIKRLFNYEWMFCLPSTCKIFEIQRALDQRFGSLKFTRGESNLRVTVKSVTCYSGEIDYSVFDMNDKIYMGIILSLLVIILFCTFYDVIKRRDPVRFNERETRYQILSSFSICTSGKKLFSTKRRVHVIECLDGLRVLSIFWIIFGHTFYVEITGMKLDLTRVPTLHENWIGVFLLNTNIVTDTFLLLSGIVLAYNQLIQHERNPDRSLNFMHLYIHRYLRVTPAYAVIIGFYATLFYKLGSGPLWDTWVGTNSRYCRENWWTNLLYVNNYVNVSNMCLSQSWYLSVDMQLIWISPVFLYPLLRFRRKIFFWILLVIGLAVSSIIPFLLTYFHELPGSMVYYKELSSTAKVFFIIYIKTYARFGPYIIGLALGYILFKTRSCKVNISALKLLISWLSATVVGLVAILGLRRFYDDYNGIEASFYAGLHRHAFVFAVSWIIFASRHGYAGFVGMFLSWRGWIPLSKLSYSTYLCHYIVLYYYAGLVRTSSDFSMINVIHSCIGNIILSLIISVIVCICFEMPFSSLNQILSGKKSVMLEQSGSHEIHERKQIETSVSSTSQVEINDILHSSNTSVKTIAVSEEDLSIYVARQSVPSTSNGFIKRKITSDVGEYQE